MVDIHRHGAAGRLHRACSRRVRALAVAPAATDGPRAGAVLDHERLAKTLLEPLRDRARDQVGAAAWRERHEDRDGAVGIVLRADDARRCRAERRADCRSEQQRSIAYVCRPLLVSLARTVDHCDPAMPASLHHLAPARGFRLHERPAEPATGVLATGSKPYFGICSLVSGCARMPVNSAIEPVDDRARRLGRRDQHLPAHRVEARQAGFVDRRNVGKPGTRKPRGDAERTDLAGLQRAGAGPISTNIIGTCPAITSLSAGTLPLVGHVRHLDAGHALEQLACRDDAARPARPRRTTACPACALA